jgi:hypothetical protein
LSKTELLLSHSKVIDNKTNNGGGVLNDIGAHAIIINSIIRENIAGKNGGGIVNRGNLELISTKIINNIAGETGGGVFSNGPFVQTNTKITNNYPNNVIVA